MLSTINSVRPVVVTMTCINYQCNNCGLELHYLSKCNECGLDLYPYDDYEWADEPAADPQDLQQQLFHMISEIGPGKLIDYKPPVNDTFSCPSDLTGCPVALKPVIDIPSEMFNKWIFLASRIDTEWIAYLYGKEINPNHYEITGMYLPKQKANPTHCEAVEAEILPGTVAAVHSHVGMNVFFSAEDLLHMNHPIEMVVNRAGEIKASVRVKLECGRWHRGEATVRLTGCEENLNMVVELQSKISED